MISIDVGDLKDEVSNLREFLSKKLSVEVKVEGKVLNVGSSKEELSRGNVKDYVERFFYRKGLSNSYNVRTEKDALKIVKKKT